MKQSQEWMQHFKRLNSDANSKLRPLTQAEMDNHIQRLDDLFKQIQLDALKEGMRRAAHIVVTDEATLYGKISDIILTTANQLTTKDL